MCVSVSLGWFASLSPFPLPCLSPSTSRSNIGRINVFDDRYMAICFGVRCCVRSHLVSPNPNPNAWNTMLRAKVISSRRDSCSRFATGGLVDTSSFFSHTCWSTGRRPACGRSFSAITANTRWDLFSCECIVIVAEAL